VGWEANPGVAIAHSMELGRGRPDRTQGLPGRRLSVRAGAAARSVGAGIAALHRVSGGSAATKDRPQQRHQEWVGWRKENGKSLPLHWRSMCGPDPVAQGLDPVPSKKGVTGGGADSGQPKSDANSDKEQRPGAPGDSDSEPSARSRHRWRKRMPKTLTRSPQ
jgi:hypothetical protein